MKKKKLHIDKDYNILSLDGGGIRGIMLLQQLVDLEKTLGCPINSVFDLISATSTSAIIAILLAEGFSAQSILDLYLKNIKILKSYSFLFNIFRSKDKYFNKVLKECVGNKNLSDLKCDVIITTYNVTRKEKTIFKSRKAKKNVTYDYKLFDVMRAGSSINGIFKPHKIGSSYFIDGGLLINNPSMISYVEVLNYRVRYNCINVLSYSTGIRDAIIDISLKRKTRKNKKPNNDILLAEQSQITDYHMKEMGLNFNSLNYIRCESYVSESSGKFNDITSINIKNLMRDSIISTINNKPLVEMFLEFIGK